MALMVSRQSDDFNQPRYSFDQKKKQIPSGALRRCLPVSCDCAWLLVTTPTCLGIFTTLSYPFTRSRPSKLSTTTCDPVCPDCSTAPLACQECLRLWLLLDYRHTELPRKNLGKRRRPRHRSLVRAAHPQ